MHHRVSAPADPGAEADGSPLDPAAELGMSPAAYRRGGEGVRISYATRPTTFGELLVAASDRGVCAVVLGDEPRALAGRLRAEFPHAELVPGDDQQLGQWLAALVAHLEGEGDAPELPLDLRATAFQLRVWDALRRIPRGETRSYAEIARELGQPSAARAVARACASNPVAVVIPCHRVVRGDGGLGGYRWGVHRKEALLQAEGGNGG